MAMTDAHLVRRFVRTVALSWALPVLALGALLPLVELPRSVAALGALYWQPWLYAALMLVASLLWFRHLLQVLMANLEEDALPPAQRFRPLWHMTLSALVLLPLFVGISALLQLWAAGLLYDSPEGVYLGLALSSLVVVIAIWVPSQVQVQGLLGEYLGPQIRHLHVLPLGVTQLISMLGVALIGATGYALLDFYQHGELSRGAMLLWVALMGYAVVVSFLNWRSLAFGLQPLRRLITSDKAADAETIRSVKPQSIDDLGALTQVLQRQLLRAEASEQQLRLSQERLRMFTDIATDFLFELDGEFKVTELSDGFVALTGLGRDQIIGRSLFDMAAVLGAEARLSAEARQRLEDHQAFDRLRVQRDARDGGPSYVELRGVPYFDATGRFCGYRGVGWDASDVVEAEQQLLAKEAELAQAQKMEAVGQLTGGVAHDFNNLLTAILGNLELAQLRQQDTEATREHLNSAAAAARRGAALVQRLLAFSRRQALSPEATDVFALLQGMEDLLRRTLGEHISVYLRCPEKVWPAMVDPNQLASAVLNLAINARDAMGSGGSLTLTLSNQRGAAPGTSLSRGDYVQIQVADTGSGIDPDVLPHVCEPFFTTKQSGEGSGLGLSMVYGFAEQTGGGLHIDSAPGRGTEVSLWLPRALSAVDSGQAAKAGQQGRDGSGELILVVEDDEAVSQVVRESLRRLGYQVVTVASGEDALEVIGRLDRLDLLLTDVMLAGDMTGVDLAERVSERKPGTRTLFMSGYTRDELSRRSDQAAEVDVLAKPFQLSELREAVQRALQLEAPLRSSSA